MWTNAFRDAVLDTYESGGAAVAAAACYVGFIKSISDWRAGTVVEADYTGYGTRPLCTLGVVGNTSPVGGRQRANDVAITFPQNTGASQDVIGWGKWSAATAGVLHDINLLDSDPPVYGVGNVDNTISSPAHGLQTDQRCFVEAAPGALLPAGLSENVAYFVLAAGLTADVFKLATTSAGVEIDITTAGAIMISPYKVVTIANAATPEFAIGSLVFQV